MFFSKLSFQRLFPRFCPGCFFRGFFPFTKCHRTHVRSFFGVLLPVNRSLIATLLKLTVCEFLPVQCLVGLTVRRAVVPVNDICYSASRRNNFYVPEPVIDGFVYFSYSLLFIPLLITTDSELPNGSA